MNAIKSFVKTSFIGGVIVLLPVAILVGVFMWIFAMIKEWISPLTNWTTGAFGLDDWAISAKLAERLHNHYHGSVVPCYKWADIPLSIKATQLASKVDTDNNSKRKKGTTSR